MLSTILEAEDTPMTKQTDPPALMEFIFLFMWTGTVQKLKYTARIQNDFVLVLQRKFGDNDRMSRQK